MNVLYTLLINIIGSIILGMLKAKKSNTDKESIDSIEIGDKRNTFYKLLKAKRMLEEKVKK